MIAAIRVTVKGVGSQRGQWSARGSSPSGHRELPSVRVTIAAGSDQVAVSCNWMWPASTPSIPLTSGARRSPLGRQPAGCLPWQGQRKDKLIFKLTLDVPVAIPIELTGNLDHSVQGKDLLDVQLPLQARDSDGDLSAEVIGHVSVQDDVPVAVDAGKTLDEGKNVTGDLAGHHQRGADDAVVRSVTINGTEHPIAASGNTSIAVTDSTGQVIGTLVINAEGNYSFTAKSGIDHSNSTLVQQMGFHLVDGDGDTDDGLLTLTIRDEAGKLTVSAVTGQGMRGERSPGIPITMNLDVGGISIGVKVRRAIAYPGAGQRPRHLLFQRRCLTTTADGKTWFIEVPPAARVAVAHR